MSDAAQDTAETVLVGGGAGTRGETRESELLPRGTLVRRYVILDPIGVGGMGVVYRAYDPELVRHIALKVMRTRHAEDSPVLSDRLQREAQALAQLSHPNIVAVYDAGLYQGDVFVAMELLEGSELRAWLTEHERSRAQILDVFIQAARGLAAAHEAGLIHRDFKPANVVVGDNGRVRVLDFGLARAVGDERRPAGDAGDDSEVNSVERPGDSGAFHAAWTEDSQITGPGAGTWSQGSLLRAHLTAYGKITGTPAYMAPEQLAGKEVDGRSDQYSFFVALYEALCGNRPPARSGRNRATGEARAQATRARVMAAATVPRRLRKILERGLARDPGDRFPDMNAVVAALEHDPAAQLRRGALVAGLVAVVAAGSWLLAHKQSGAGVDCRRGTTRLESVWNEDVKETVRAQFAASGRNHAAATAERVVAVVDEYGRQWAAMRVDACEATHVRGEQSAQLLDLRMRCLDRRLDKLGALVELFASRPSEQVVDEAVDAAYRLPAPAGCGDAEALASAAELPADEATRARIGVLAERLDRVEALQATGRHLEGAELAENVVAQARELGYAPLTAEALYLLGSLQGRAGDHAKAEVLLREASREAARAGDDGLDGAIWIELVGNVGYSQARFQEAMWIGHMADAAVLRAGDPPLLRATLAGQLGSVAFAAGRFDEALSLHERALEIRRRELDGSHPDVAESLNHLGSTLYQQGRFGESAGYHEQALPLRVASLGAEHPDVGHSHMNFALALVPQGKHESAHEHYLRALEIFRSALGPRHFAVGLAHNNIGELWWVQDRFERAERHYREAVAIFEETLRADHVNLAYPLTGLGQACVALGRYGEALALLERALALRSPDGPERADGGERPERPDSADAADGAEGTDEGGAETAERALTRFYLARARWHAARSGRPASPSAARDALAAARGARAAYAAAPAHIDAELTKMTAWLASLGP